MKARCTEEEMRGENRSKGVRLRAMMRLRSACGHSHVKLLQRLLLSLFLLLCFCTLSPVLGLGLSCGDCVINMCAVFTAGV